MLDERVEELRVGRVLLDGQGVGRVSFGQVFVAGGEALDEESVFWSEVFEEGGDSEEGRSRCALLKERGSR